jgi:hypothetical protein
MAKASQLKPGAQVDARVELAQGQSHVLVLSLPAHGNAIAFASTANTNTQRSPALQHYTPGQRVACTVAPPAASLLDTQSRDSLRGRLLLALPAAPVLSVAAAGKGVGRDVGTVGTGVVKAVHALHADVQLGRRLGRLHACELRDWDPDEVAAVRFSSHRTSFHACNSALDRTSVCYLCCNSQLQLPCAEALSKSPRLDSGRGGHIDAILRARGTDC